jgi:phospholipid-binding lipoprotein MlaA
MDLIEWEEDFGQTLGHWGVGDGPFLVLPILGPSNLRDTTGLVADGLMFSAIDPLNFDSNDDLEVPFYVLQAIDARHRTAFRYYETGSAFEYELVRLLYGKYRELQIAK